MGFIGLFVLLLAPVGVYVWLRHKVVSHIPENYPGRVLLQANNAVVVCAGDSLTHGNISVNYVDRLANRFAGQPIQFLNAGRNADLTYSLLDRLDNVIAAKPDVVTILIGTNDVNASLNEQERSHYQKLGRIDAGIMPTFATFQANYRQVVSRLKSAGIRRIALASLPVMSEDLTHEANHRAEAYSAFIRELCQEERLMYLPVREAMTTYLAGFPAQRPHRYEAKQRLMTLNVARFQLLGQSWDALTQHRGNQLTHDMLHLNTAGADFIADAVATYLETNLLPQPILHS